MSKPKLMGTKRYYIEDRDDEYGISEIRISLNARDRKAVLRNKRSRYEYMKHLREVGVIERGGCQCSHCMQGWDCCGNWFLSHTRIEPARKGVTIVKTYARNI